MLGTQSTELLPLCILMGILLIISCHVHIKMSLECMFIMMWTFSLKDCNIFVLFEMQIPLYPATIFQSENDGEGMNVVLYFKLSEKFSKDLTDQFRESISVRRISSLSFFAVIVPHVT